MASRFAARVLPLGLSCLVGAVGSADATPLTFAYTGTITSADLSAFSVGDPVSGTFTFESTTADTDANPSLGRFLAITSGSFSFGSYAGTIGTTGSTNPTLLIGNVASGCCDSYNAYDDTPVGPNVEDFGFVFQLVQWELYLEDATGTVFGSTALPTTPPPLSSFEFDFVELRFNPFAAGIMAHVESLTLVPEPSVGALLLAVGVVAARGRRRSGLRARGADAVGGAQRAQAVALRGDQLQHVHQEAGDSEHHGADHQE